ncbi:MAG: 16S rRNA (cytosine(1402)-N(4))-methyltransferase RsmH [Acidobacteriota bacterium]
MKNLHYPVMNKEVLSIFSKTDKDIFVDCTVGMGGHTSKLMKEFPGSSVAAIDMDRESLEMAKKNLKEFGERVSFYEMEFTDLFEQASLPWKRVSGILVDPGLSIYQLKNEERGFSFSEDSELDMRKSKDLEISAHTVINRFKENELTDIFVKFGELKKAPQFSKRIIERRLFKSIDTTGILRKIVEDFYGWRPKRGKTHPAAKVFQALRIFVNKELEGIELFLKKAPEMLSSGARIIFLTFHSVEDRLIKTIFREMKGSEKVKIIKPFPMKPAEEEIKVNNPSRSAKLRAVEIV